MGRSKRWVSDSYWKQQHTIKNDQGSRHCAKQQERGAVSGQTEQQLVREGRICFSQIGTSLAWQIQEWISFLVPVVVAKVGMSLPSVEQTAQTQVRACTGVFCEQAVKRKTIGWGKRKKNIFLFCFPRNTVRALHVPMSRSQLPSVKHVYAIDYKSMIGGCRTLLVMNSVNPSLISLRYLNHDWVTSQQV